MLGKNFSWRTCGRSNDPVPRVRTDFDKPAAIDGWVHGGVLVCRTPMTHPAPTRSLWLGAAPLALLFAILPACASAPAEVKAPIQETPVAVNAPPVIPPPSVSEIKTTVSKKNPDLRQCYIAGTFKDAELAGTVNVTFTIGPDGRVSSATDAGSDMPDDEVVSCVLGVFARLQFSGGGNGETEITYPVRFGQAG